MVIAVASARGKDIFIVGYFRISHQFQTIRMKINRWRGTLKMLLYVSHYFSEKQIIRSMYLFLCNIAHIYEKVCQEIRVSVYK